MTRPLEDIIPRTDTDDLLVNVCQRLDQLLAVLTPVALEPLVSAREDGVITEAEASLAGSVLSEYEPKPDPKPAAKKAPAKRKPAARKKPA